MPDALPDGDPIAAIPVKAFEDAKERLGRAVPAERRPELVRALASRTAQAAAEAGAGVVIVAGDAEVARWAAAAGYRTLAPDRPGLDAAARASVEFAASLGVPWAVIHADLPTVTPADFAAVFTALRRGPVIVPSRDGGSNVLASPGHPIDFAYGPGSFARHLRRLAGTAPAVAIRPGLMLDLDTPGDLARARALPHGAWLDDFLS